MCMCGGEDLGKRAEEGYLEDFKVSALEFAENGGHFGAW